MITIENNKDRPLLISAYLWFMGVGIILALVSMVPSMIGMSSMMSGISGASRSPAALQSLGRICEVFAVTGVGIWFSVLLSAIVWFLLFSRNIFALYYFCLVALFKLYQTWFIAFKLQDVLLPAQLIIAVISLAWAIYLFYYKDYFK